MIIDVIIKHKQYVVSALIIIIAIFLFFKFNQPTQVELIQSTNELDIAQFEEEQINYDDADKQMVTVEIKGAVKKPGVYELPKDARVINVIELAELVQGADLLNVNQSTKLVDEMVIYIPKLGEEITSQYQLSPKQMQSTENNVVNINIANKEELMTLNGVGEKTAEKIITYREENGLFMKLEDIKNVAGIGDKTFENLETYITIE